MTSAKSEKRLFLSSVVFLHLFLSSVDKKLGKIQFETHHQIRRNFHNFDFCTFMDNLIWFAISVCFAFPWRKTQKVLFSMKKATKGITEWHLAEEKVGWLSFSSQSWLHITSKAGYILHIFFEVTDERKSQFRRKLELEIVLQKFVKLKGGNFTVFFKVWVTLILQHHWYNVVF